jgi:tetratricopeptide (TPR) repeat protein
MMKRKDVFLLAVLAISLVFAGFGIAQEQPSQEKGIVDLEDIIANPEAFKTTSVTFRAQFHKMTDVYSPFYTVFNPSGYLNFSAWEYNAPLWTKAGYKSDFPFLYIEKRDYRLADQVLELEPYTRFEATGLIRSTFNNTPWIQVTSIKTIPRYMTKNAIQHMAKGYARKKKGDHINAVLEFSQAYSEELPREVQVLIRKEEGKSLFILGKYPEAVVAFEQAQRLLRGKKDSEVELLLKEAMAMTEYEEEGYYEEAYEEEEVTESDEGEEYVEYPEIILEPF